MMLHLHGNEPVEIDTLNANTRSKKPNAPTHYGFFDPLSVITRRRTGDE